MSVSGCICVCLSLSVCVVGGRFGSSVGGCMNVCACIYLHVLVYVGR